MKAKAEIRFFEQMGLLALAGTIMILTNMIGYKYRWSSPSRDTPFSAG